MGHFACKLSVLHIARDVAYESVYWHYVDGGVAATREGAWDGFEYNQKRVGKNHHLLHIDICFHSWKWKELNFHLFSILM